MKKKGYFLTIDAFIAVSVVVVGVAIIIAQYSFTPYEPQNIFYSEDLSDFLTSTQIYEINDQNYTYLSKYKSNGNITDMRNTVAEQLVEFAYRNGSECPDCAEMASNMIDEFVNETVSEKFSYSVKLKNDSRTFVLSRSNTTPINDSELVTPSKKIASAFVNRSFVVETLEVDVWK
ncbi:MAG: hypothetical protein ACQEP1_04190 [Nanobdellota archaeon]